MARIPDAFWPIRLGRGLFSGPLSADLYTDSGRCACELARNGMVACQRDVDRWDPSRIDIELVIVARHPLVGGPALVGMDAGSGFTKADIDRFCTVGPDEDDGGSTRHGGAAQKRLGRFAYFALQSDRGPDRGFTIFTRTSSDGPVTSVEVTPRALSDQRLPKGTLARDATELGSCRNHRGRFSAIVIPRPVFGTNDELEQAIALHLPRKQELCGTIRIGGKPFVPPPLANGVVVAPSEAGFEAYLERVTQGTRGGIWLVDLTTGFRVGFCPSLTAHLPYPLGRTDLGGDIFLPGLLAQQDTSRGGLRHAFLRSKAWRRTVDLLLAHVVQPARALLEDTDVVGQSTIGRLITDDIADLLRATYGEPDGAPPTSNGANGIGCGGGKGGGGKGGGGKGGSSSGPRKPRLVPIKIGDETWWVGTTRDDQNVFASADADTRTVMVNAVYDVIPRAKAARVEHTLLGLLGAIAKAKSPYDTTAAQRFVTERRRETLGKQA